MTTKAKITLYPSEETKERLEALCERERRSVNAQVLLWIEDILDQEQPRFRSIAVTGEKAIDMLSGEEVDPMTLEPKRKKQRLVTCPHRLGPDQFCRSCDG